MAVESDSRRRLAPTVTGRDPTAIGRTFPASKIHLQRIRSHVLQVTDDTEIRLNRCTNLVRRCLGRSWRKMEEDLDEVTANALQTIEYQPVVPAFPEDSAAVSDGRRQAVESGMHPSAISKSNDD